MKNQIQDWDKILASFMGWCIDEQTETFYLPDVGFVNKIPPLFNKRWDWIMPVVAKLSGITSGGITYDLKEALFRGDIEEVYNEVCNLLAEIERDFIHEVPDSPNLLSEETRSQPIFYDIQIFEIPVPAHNFSADSYKKVTIVVGGYNEDLDGDSYDWFDTKEELDHFISTGDIRTSNKGSEYVIVTKSL